MTPKKRSFKECAVCGDAFYIGTRKTVCQRCTEAKIAQRHRDLYCRRKQKSKAELISL